MPPPILEPKAFEIKPIAPPITSEAPKPAPTPVTNRTTPTTICNADINQSHQALPLSSILFKCRFVHFSYSNSQYQPHCFLNGSLWHHQQRSSTTLSIKIPIVSSEIFSLAILSPYFYVNKTMWYCHYNIKIIFCINLQKKNSKNLILLLKEKIKHIHKEWVNINDFPPTSPKKRYS